MAGHQRTLIFDAVAELPQDALTGLYLCCRQLSCSLAVSSG